MLKQVFTLGNLTIKRKFQKLLNNDIGCITSNKSKKQDLRKIPF